jgi:pimeloyl-ACP methyl ester carboxylesterase
MAQTHADARRNQTIKLRDGRTLGYAEYGDPSGEPLLFFHGTPGSRLMAVPAWNDVSLGQRIIVPDRPGLGLSDFKPNRTILDWPDDVAELTDALGLDRFVVAGVSGGGPHSLACAYKLGDRVIRAGVISGAAQIETAADLEGMHGPNKTAFTLARRAPWILRPLFEVMGFVAKRWPDAAFAEKGMPPADVEIMKDPALKEALRSEAPEAYRQGGRAVAHEAVMFARPWGFRLEDVKRPVLLWHGSDDKNAPLAMAKTMEARIPDCTAKYYEGEGHLYFFRRWPEISEALRRSAS